MDTKKAQQRFQYHLTVKSEPTDSQYVVAAAEYVSQVIDDASKCMPADSASLKMVRLADSKRSA